MSDEPASTEPPPAPQPIPKGAPDDALRGLVERGVLSAEQAVAVREALAVAPADGPPRWLAEAAGYLGGVLMLGGASVLLSTQWEAMTRAARFASLAAITLALAIAAAVIAGAGEPTRVRRRVAGVLAAIAACTAAGAAGIIVHTAGGTAAGLTGLAVAAIGYAVLRTVPPLLVAGVMTAISPIAITQETFSSPVALTAVAVVGCGAVWMWLSLARLITPLGVGLGIGVAIALFGAQLGLEVSGAPVWGYGLTFVVALACFALYSARRSAVLLVGGVVGIALAAPEAVWDWTDGAAGGALILLVAGAALILASGIGLGLWRRPAP